MPSNLTSVDVSPTASIIALSEGNSLVAQITLAMISRTLPGCEGILKNKIHFVEFDLS